MSRAKDTQTEKARRLKAARNSPPLGVIQPPRIPTGRLASSLVAYLRKNPGLSYTPNDLAVAVKAKKADVKKELCRLLLPGRDDTPPPVQRTGRGLYACFLGPRELALIENPQPKVHAIQLVWKAPSLPPFGGSPPRSPPLGVLDAGFGQTHRSWVHDEASRSYRLQRWHGPLRITLQVFPTTQTLMASIDSSSTPLDGPAIGHLRTWLEATLQAEGFAWSEPRVATVEINRDFTRVRLNGLEAARFFLGRMGLGGTQLKLEALEGALVQIYQKEELGVMRQEIRLQPRGLDLPNLQALVVSMFYGPVQPEAMPPGPPEGGYA